VPRTLTERQEWERMVRVERDICGNPPRMYKRTVFECDECETRCYPEGLKEERLYQTPHGQLCFECMCDLMDISEVKE